MGQRQRFRSPQSYRRCGIHIPPIPGPFRTHPIRLFFSLSLLRHLLPPFLPIGSRRPMKPERGLYLRNYECSPTGPFGGLSFLFDSGQKEEERRERGRVLSYTTQPLPVGIERVPDRTPSVYDPRGLSDYEKESDPKGRRSTTRQDSGPGTTGSFRGLRVVLLLRTSRGDLRPARDPVGGTCPPVRTRSRNRTVVETRFT